MVRRAGWVRRIVLSGAVLLAATAAGLGAATAAPITVWFDRQAGFGLEAASVAAAQGGGTPSYAPPALFTGSGLFDFDTPDPIQTDVGVPPSPSRANPSTGSTKWGITPLTQDWSDLWIIFRAHSTNDANFDFYDPGPGDPSAPGTVGLSFDPAVGWALIQPDPVGFPDTYYLAYFLGDVAQDETAGVPIDYRVAQTLFLSSNVYVFPRYLVGFTSFAVPVPEPSALLLLGLASLGAAGARRWR